MVAIPQAFQRYLDKLFAALLESPPVFSCVAGYASGGYSRFVHFAAEEKEYQFSICCCCTEGANPAHLFFGAYVVDALNDVFRCVLSERGGNFFVHSDAPLFGGMLPDKAASELRKLAGQRLEDDLERSYGLSFDVMDCLSLTYYEQERAKGNLLFVPKARKDLEELCVWSVSGPDRVECDMKQLRVLRKLLAGTAPDSPDEDGSALLFAREGELPVFCGAVLLEDGLPPATLRSMCAQVRISGPLRWELSLFGKVVCHRNASGLHFPDSLDHSDGEREAEERIRDALMTAFERGHSADAVRKNLDSLTQIALSVRRQRHGAALMVADWSQEPWKTTLDRLKRHRKAVPVSFTSLENQAVTCAAKMDGAILASVRSGQIVALAAILDGKSCIAGDTSRGARYNSIANATSLLRSPITKAEIVSFVFSSDGGMDVLT